MADLFSTLSVVGKELANRIVMAPAPSGYATPTGFVSSELIAYLTQRAAGGVGLIISEPFRISQPDPDAGEAHLGLYHDAFVPALRQLSVAVRAHRSRLIVTLEEPAAPVSPSIAALDELCERFIVAAWRAHCAGCDGIMLSSADGGLLHQLISPLRNQRADQYGLSIDGRMRLSIAVIEGIRSWLGRRLIVGFRLLAEEFTPGGMSMHDARVVARRVAGAGVRLLDVTVAPEESANLARFPGWAIPLANAIKRISPDVPVIGSGQLGDPFLADSIIHDRSVDLVMLHHALIANPNWPHDARRLLDGAAEDLP